MWPISITDHASGKCNVASVKKTSGTATKKTAKKKTAKKKTAKKQTTAKKAVNKSGKRLKIRQVKSGIGSSGRVRRTLTALGLKHHQSETTVPDNVSTQGMLRKVHHLVRVVGEEG